MKGKFITFEGAEGSGKSTQIDLANKYLKRKGYSVVFIREPGGVHISEKIRKVLLDVKNKKMNPECETMLYMAARAQLVEEKIAPALKKGKIVLCDRFLDSTVVYQGYGGGIDINFIKQIGEVVTQNIKPDLTIIFDIAAKKGLSRITGKKDRIEQKGLNFHNRVRRGYLDIARKEPGRIKLITGNKGREEIHNFVRKHLDRILKKC